ncbi:MAG: metallophosphoesterase [Clostridia bacterium]|nr:metallophosphoesterase [Clostridia bacterium]
MKIAIFSDVHGNYQATKAILEDINKNNKEVY